MRCSLQVTELDVLDPGTQTAQSATSVEDSVFLIKLIACKAIGERKTYLILKFEVCYAYFWIPATLCLP
jgi:hypothetical protein